MRIRATLLFVASFLVCCGAQAHAGQYPPGVPSYITHDDSCLTTLTDTLSIVRVQTNPCKPGTACAGFGTGGSVGCDSVYGVKGIVIAIKNNGISRTFYMQARRTNLQYTGMDVFNGNGLTNPNIQIGDSVSVSGKTEEGFKKTSPSTIIDSGETQISGFDASNSTVSYADLPVNILSSGNSLPNFHT